MTFTKYHSDVFYGALAAAAMIAPIILVLAAGTLPEGVQRGDVIVFGHGVILAVVAVAMVVRAAYALGFNKALKISVSEPHYVGTV
jgi:predicted tellurium resistance membrane protein TerC